MHTFHDFRPASRPGIADAVNSPYSNVLTFDENQVNGGIAALRYKAGDREFDPSQAASGGAIGKLKLPESRYRFSLLRGHADLAELRTGHASKKCKLLLAAVPFKCESPPAEMVLLASRCSQDSNSG